jgi:hypothetical protein
LDDMNGKDSTNSGFQASLNMALLVLNEFNHEVERTHDIEGVKVSIHRHNFNLHMLY